MPNNLFCSKAIRSALGVYRRNGIQQQRDIICSVRKLQDPPLVCIDETAFNSSVIPLSRDGPGETHFPVSVEWGLGLGLSSS
jgi:hypothetical protein